MSRRRVVRPYNPPTPPSHEFSLAVNTVRVVFSRCEIHTRLIYFRYVYTQYVYTHVYYAIILLLQLRRALPIIYFCRLCVCARLYIYIYPLYEINYDAKWGSHSLGGTARRTHHRLLHARHVRRARARAQRVSRCIRIRSQRCPRSYLLFYYTRERMSRSYYTRTRARTQ